MNALTITLSVVQVLVVFAASVALSARRRPTEAIAWILVIIFVPVVGLVVYLLLGAGRLPRRRREKQTEVNDLVRARTPLGAHAGGAVGPAWLSSARTLNQNLGALPMVTDNSVELLPDYDETLARIAADIDAARHTVHVEFYILVRDHATTPVFDALARAAHRGVTVRVLSDHVSGLMFPNRKDTRRFMREAGIEWHPMLPLRPWRGQWQRPDLRNHRKLVVIDGRIGYTGSQNLIDATYLKPRNVVHGLHWLELMVRVTGPAVGELDAVFVTDWYSETDEILPLTSPEPRTPTGEVGTERHSGGTDLQVVPSGPSFENDNNLKLFVLMIQNAARRISITSPYFVPDESTAMALVTAAARGVDVELFVSEIGDQKLVHHAQRSYYEELLRAGVAIHLYRPPTVLHAKHFSIDDDVAVIGSSNMDIRSFRLNMEVSVLIHGREFVDRLREVEDGYRAASRHLELAEWVRRPLRQKVWDSLARLTSSLQ